MRMRTTGDERTDVVLGTHGEDYGSWMSTPVFIIIGVLALVAAALAAVAFTVLDIAPLGVLCIIVTLAFLALLVWFFWIRRQYAFGGGEMMAKTHEVVLNHLGFDGTGRLLEVGCGSGALAIRAAIRWPEAEVLGVDTWGAVYAYSREECERNAASEGVASHCAFLTGDATRLAFPDETFDAVVSNYVYHNVTGADKRELVRETLRVLKRGGVFALNDDMKPRMYGDVETFAQELRDAGLAEVRVVDTAREIFGSSTRAALMMLGESRMLVGRK